MKILLIGEFSGVHNNLKYGLTQLGHQVILLADSDGYRGFPSDYRIRKTRKLHLLNIISFLLRLKKFTGYDVVQFINPFAIPIYYQYFGIQDFILKHNKLCVYYACGTTPALYDTKDQFKYFPFNERINFNKWHKRSYFEKFVRKVDYIIPSMYDYYLGFSSLPKTLKPIPLPCSGNYNDNLRVNTNSLSILYGMTKTRVDEKGGNYILDSLELLKKECPSVCVNEVCNLPFVQWYDLLNSCDIIIDQCTSFTYGMTSIFALERGVIVLSVADPIAMNYLSIQNNIVRNIIPDISDILSELKKIINLDENDLLKLKQSSVEQARLYHDPIKVANQFVSVYQKSI